MSNIDMSTAVGDRTRVSDRIYRAIEGLKQAAEEAREYGAPEELAEALEAAAEGLERPDAQAAEWLGEAYDARAAAQEALAAA